MHTMEGLQNLWTSETLHRITPLIPCGILVEYFDSHKIAIELDGDLAHERLSDSIEKAIRRAPKETRVEVAAELDELNAHADFEFVRDLIESGRIRTNPVLLETVFSSLISHHARAMWARVHHPSLYFACLRFEQTEKLKYRRCRVPVRETQPGKAEVDALAKGLSRLSLSYGQGKGVVIKEFEIGTCRLYLCYVEGAPQRDLNFDKKSKLGHLDRRPAYEVVYRYDPADRTLRTYAKGGAVLTRQAQQVFGEVMFGVELPLDSEVGRYNLNRFLKPGGCLLDITGTPEVKAASLIRIQLQSYDPSLDASTHVFRRSATSQAIDRKIQLMLTSGFLVDDPQVDKVRLRFEFRPSPGRRCTYVNVDVTVGSCPLRDERRYEIIAALLKEWKIDEFTASADDSVDTGTPAQCILQLS